MRMFSRTVRAVMRQRMPRYKAQCLHTNITTTTSIDTHLQKGFFDEWRQIWNELGRDQWMLKHGNIELPSKLHSEKSKRLPGTPTSELHIPEEKPHSSEDVGSLMQLIRNLNNGIPKVYKPSFPEM